MVQRALTGNIAHAVMVHPPSNGTLQPLAWSEAESQLWVHESQDSLHHVAEGRAGVHFVPSVLS